MTGEANTAIDIGLNRHIGLPDSYRLGRKQAYKIYTALIGAMNASFVEISPLVLMYYFDKNGDFTKCKKFEDRVVNEIFKNMNKDDQFTLLQYIDENK